MGRAAARRDPAGTRAPGGQRALGFASVGSAAVLAVGRPLLLLGGRPLLLLLLVRARYNLVDTEEHRRRLDRRLDRLRDNNNG